MSHFSLCAVIPGDQIDDGEWTARGTMGWWGISTNEKPDRSWYDEIAALAKEIQPDDVLVAVDCHI